MGSIVLSAVAAVVVSRWFLGNEPLFRVPAFELTHPSELLVCAAIGLVGGLLAVAFVKSIVLLRGRLHQMPNWTQYVQPLAAGLLIGVAGLWLPQVMGAGYDSVDSALRGQFSWRLSLLLGVAKLLATLICFGAGIPGGMFAPALFTGAMIGGGLGGLAQHYWPFPTSSAGAYVLVGMGTFFAGVFRAPMTSMFMVFEVSASYVIILPVMIANTVSYLVSRRLQSIPFFDVVARQEGMDLPSHEQQREQQLLRVEDAMEPVPALVGDSLAWGTSDELPRVYPDLSLDAVLHLFGSRTSLPVVSRADSRQILGVVTLDSIHRAYGILREDRKPKDVA